jgi:hypothetical protein
VKNLSWNNGAFGGYSPDNGSVPEEVSGLAVLSDGLILRVSVAGEEGLTCAVLRLAGHPIPVLPHSRMRFRLRESPFARAGHDGERSFEYSGRVQCHGFFLITKDRVENALRLDESIELNLFEIKGDFLSLCQ